MTDSFAPSLEANWPPAGRTGEWWMFWREDHPNTPPVQLLGEAIAYFKQKYSLAPNQARVPLSWESLLINEEGKPMEALPEFPGLKIRKVRTMLKGHLWLSHLNGYQK